MLSVIRNGYRLPFVNEWPSILLDYNKAAEIMAICNFEIVNSMFNFRGRTIIINALKVALSRKGVMLNTEINCVTFILIFKKCEDHKIE